MKCSSPAWLALSAAATLLLSSGCATRFVPPTQELKVNPQECLRTCTEIPEPTGPGEAELMRWEMQMVQWGERCAQLTADCAEASR